MKSSTKDQVKGTFREVKGTMKNRQGRSSRTLAW